MYRLHSTNPFHHGTNFDSLAKAKQYADELSAKDPIPAYDVVALVDRETYRTVYTPKTCRAGQPKRGTFRHQPPTTNKTNRMGFLSAT